METERTEQTRGHLDLSLLLLLQTSPVFLLTCLFLPLPLYRCTSPCFSLETINHGCADSSQAVGGRADGRWLFITRALNSPWQPQRAGSDTSSRVERNSSGQDTHTERAAVDMKGWGGDGCWISSNLSYFILLHGDLLFSISVSTLHKNIFFAYNWLCNQRQDRIYHYVASALLIMMLEKCAIIFTYQHLSLWS